ncbi:MAG: hypothetical protein CMP36_03235 [Rickettsiales bacterium]|nr:hypothetical protein [Rickettsiales bacterium]OUV79115.1 MAG: hypothetical protein CBC91_03990 [Rickettsiales bacterium TMED131]
MNKKLKKNNIFIKLKPSFCNNRLNINNITQTLHELGIKESDFYYFFPDKIQSLCIFFFQTVQGQLESKVSKKLRVEKSISKRVNYILLELIKLFEQDKAVTKYFLNYMSLKPIFLKKTSLIFSNNVWYLLKDKSVDFNFYTKRLILSQILINTTLFWRGSAKMSDTEDYINRQIEFLGKFGFYKSKLKKFASKLTPKDFLSKLDFLHKN